MEGSLAEIRMYAGNVTPRGWLYCEGQLLSITTHGTLFSVLGTAFGGNGTTHFALPDFRGRAAVGISQGTGLSNIQKGTTIGSGTATLQVANLPAHNHNITGTITPQTATDGALESTPNGRYPGPGRFYTPALDLADMAPIAATGLSSEMTGSGDTFSIMQPSLGVHYIICVEGDYPCYNIA